MTAEERAALILSKLDLKDPETLAEMYEYVTLRRAEEEGTLDCDESRSRLASLAVRFHGLAY